MTRVLVTGGRGTEDCIRRAKAAGINVIRIGTHPAEGAGIPGNEGE